LPHVLNESFLKNHRLDASSSHGAKKMERGDFMAVVEVLQDSINSTGDCGSELRPRCASDLAKSLEAASPTNTNRDVIDLFKNHPDLLTLPVVEDGIPIGLINRGIFLTGFSQPFHREIYERKSCIAFMDKNPLIVDHDLPVDELGRLTVSAGAKVLQDGFIITKMGKFLGVGTGLDLLKALGQLEAERNRVMRESIEYAQLIQGALLGTSLRELKTAGLAESHLLWEPRDQVGGDAFFARRVVRDGRRGLFLALMDCTGHGVPGAFTAMLMTSSIGHAVDLATPWEPGLVLAEVNRRVKAELGQKHRTTHQECVAMSKEAMGADEGMDVTCIWVDLDSNDIVFAGAKHSLWVFGQDAEEPEEIKGDRIGVGYVSTPDDQIWTSQTLHFKPGTILLGTSDGIVDQIGGPRRIAFGKRHLWEAFQETSSGVSLKSRVERVSSDLEVYQGAEMRRDDVCLVAIRM